MYIYMIRRELYSDTLYLSCLIFSIFQKSDAKRARRKEAGTTKSFN